MKKITEFKKWPAQQLVEFLLVAPFIVIILGIVTEYAYALNINMTLNQGIKEVTANMYYDIKVTTNKKIDDVKDSALANLKTYLDDNKVPTEAENALGVSYDTLGNNTVFKAEYTYIPAFTLPNVYFKFMPDKFIFYASSAVPSAFLNGNNYQAGVKTASLNNIWSGAKGAKSSGAAHNEMLFLVPTLGTKYKTVDWAGNWDNCILDTSTAKISGACTDSGKTFKEYEATRTNPHTNIISVHDGGADGWDKILGRTLGMADSSGKTRGNYDNIDVSTYNSGVMSGGTKYSVVASGAQVFAYTTDDNIANLK